MLSIARRSLNNHGIPAISFKVRLWARRRQGSHARARFGRAVRRPLAAKWMQLTPPRQRRVTRCRRLRVSALKLRTLMTTMPPSATCAYSMTLQNHTKGSTTRPGFRVIGSPRGCHHREPLSTFQSRPTTLMLIIWRRFRTPQSLQVQPNSLKRWFCPSAMCACSTEEREACGHPSAM